jgi:hypothetical protein
MRPQIKLAAKIFAGPGLFSLVLLSGVAGAGAGLICGFFRLALEEADRLRTAVPVWWHAQPLLGCSLLVVGAATAAAGITASPSQSNSVSTTLTRSPSRWDI